MVGVDVVNIIIPTVRLGVQLRRALESPAQYVVHQQALEASAIGLVGVNVVAPGKELHKMSRGRGETLICGGRTRRS